MNKWCVEKLTHPTVNAIVSILIVVIGLGASLYAEKLREPLNIIPDGYISLALWILFIVLSFLFFFTRRAEKLATDAERSSLNDTHDKLYKQSETLEKLIRTMPPADFMRIYARICSECFDVYRDATQAKDKESLERYIRRLLNGIATLINVFDKNRAQTIYYGINIMTFEAPPANGQGVNFFDAGIENIEGVLKLNVALSTNTNDGKPDPDTSVETICFPIPKQHRTTKGKWRVLAGAPFCFVTGNPILFPKIHELGRWLDQEGDFTQEIKDEVHAYFTRSPGKEIQSFVSLPIKSPDQQKTVAVLNIHKNAENILYANAEKLGEFVDMITSITLMLSVLLAKRSSL